MTFTRLTSITDKTVRKIVTSKGCIAANCDADELLDSLPKKQFIQLALLDPPYNRRTRFIHYADSQTTKEWVVARVRHLQKIHERLCESGSAWIHLDDSEVHAAKTAFDQVFGRGNFVASIVWQKTISRDNRTAISTSHEYLLVYAKNYSSFLKYRNLLDADSRRASRYTNPDNDPRGPWTSGDLTAKAGPGRRKSQFYSLLTPSGRKVSPSPGTAWRFTKDRMEQLISENRIFFGNGNRMPRLKRFRSEVADGLVPNTWWSGDDVGTMDSAKRDLKRAFPNLTPFETPKPLGLARRVIQIATKPNDYVIDVYGGSGTTAVAAQQLKRRWLTAEREDLVFDDYLVPRIAGELETGKASRRMFYIFRPKREK